MQPPKTWDELKAAAQKIMAGEGNANLRGFETAGAPIEGTVCTYLVRCGVAGEDLTRDGKLNLGGEAAKKPFQLWADLKAANVTPPNLAEIPTTHSPEHAGRKPDLRHDLGLCLEPARE